MVVVRTESNTDGEGRVKIRSFHSHMNHLKSIIYVLFYLICFLYFFSNVWFYHVRPWSICLTFVKDAMEISILSQTHVRNLTFFLSSFHNNLCMYWSFYLGIELIPSWLLQCYANLHDLYFKGCVTLINNNIQKRSRS